MEYLIWINLPMTTIAQMVVLFTRRRRTTVNNVSNGVYTFYEIFKNKNQINHRWQRMLVEYGSQTTQRQTFAKCRTESI